jgi:cell shape-determining protein MreC
MKYKNKKDYYLPLSLLLLIVLFIFDFFGLSIYISKFVGRGIKPALIFSNRLVDSFESPFFTIRKSINSARKVQMLEYRYSEVLAQLSELDELKRENQDLRSILENSDRQARDSIITSPVVSHVGPSIGVGKKDGVEVGDLVFVAQTLVGRVSSVDEHYSRVHLIYQKDFEPLVAETDEGYKGLIKGDGKRILLTEIKSDEEPSLEGRITTIGQVGVEKGLFVGQVGKTISQPSDSVQTFVVLQYVDFYQANIVEIYK